MDISKFKDIIQKLSILRNYSSLLVPVVLVLVGAVLFVPTQLMSSNLRKRMASNSVSRGKQIESLSRSAVSRDQWKMEREYQLALQNDANQTALLAEQSTRRQLLSYKIFPEPKDTSTLIFEEFGRQFRVAMDGLIARLNGRECPTDAELERSLQVGSTSSRSSRRRSSGRLSQRLKEVDAAIVDVLCQAKAESASVYANPVDLDGYEFWEKYEYTGMNKAVEDCWYWQLAYWIVEDVVDTIDVLNSGSNSVLTSPVKRLLEVSFVTSSERFRKRATGEGDRPSYVLSTEDGLAEPWTGRVCNDDIDVVHFNVSVLVSTKAFFPFMQQLCSAKQHKFSGFFGNAQEQTFMHNQITVLESNITSIDREDETHSYYRYGEDAVVELDLICEYIFSRNGYDEVKPESVKQSLMKIEE